MTRFAFPTPIAFGAGARKLVGPHLLERGIRRPLIVTDRALAALPVTAEFKGHLAGLDVAVFGGVFGNPTCAQVMAGAAAYKAHGADAGIGFGGGAALDVSKVVGLMAVHEGDVLEYVWEHPQVRPITHTLPYYVALPTTSGTGSEIGRSAVMSENDTYLKRTVFSAHIPANVADMHHGLANALMIDTVLAWDFEVVPQKFDELAHAAGVSGGGFAFVAWLKHLKALVGITGGLAARGVKPEQVPRLAQLAEVDFTNRTNPRTAKAADHERLLKQAM